MQGLLNKCYIFPFPFFFLKECPALFSPSRYLRYIFYQSSCHLGGVVLEYGSTPIEMTPNSLCSYHVSCFIFHLFFFFSQQTFLLLSHEEEETPFFKDLGTQWEFLGLWQLITVTSKGWRGNSPSEVSDLSRSSISFFSHKALDIEVLAQVLSLFGYCC